MNRSFHIHPAVYNDIVRAKLYYESLGIPIPAGFEENIEGQLRFISNFPDVGGKLFNSYRRQFIPRSVYLLAYRVNNDSIDVLALLHGRRKPRSNKDILNGRQEQE